MSNEIRVDTRRIVAAGATALDLSSDAVQSIISSPVFVHEGGRTVAASYSKAPFREDEPEQKATVDDVIQETKVATDLISQSKDIILGRAKAFTMKVSNKTQPDLYRACQILFGQDKFNGQVTFSMYISVMTYLLKLGAELGQQNKISLGVS